MTTWAQNLGYMEGMVVFGDNGVDHSCVNIVWGRNTGSVGFHILCDMEEKLPSYAGSDNIEIERLRGAGIRYRATARIGRTTCIACLAVRAERWIPMGWPG